MIATELYNGQGFGNQLWVYAVTRIIADSKKCGFSILSKNEFKGKEFMDLDFGEDLGEYNSNEGPCNILPNGIKNYYAEKKEIHSELNLDISRTDYKLFDVPNETKIDGNLQSTKYLKNKREDILKWFKINHFKNYDFLDENSCIIHLRCGDFYGQKDVFLPESYYRNAMSIIKKENEKVKFYCVTDQPNIARRVFSDIEVIGSSIDGVEDNLMASHHFGGSISTDFSIMSRVKYLIIPNSSFSWWAAYLNTESKMIIAPKYWSRFNISNGYWSTSDMIADEFLYLDREGKIFTPIECEEEKQIFEEQNLNIFKTI